jgi:hypothetical protein
MKSQLIKTTEGYHLTAVLNGEIITGTLRSEDVKNEFLRLKELGELTKESITSLFSTEKPIYQKYKDFIQRLKDWNHPYLEFKNNSIVYKGIPLAIPEFLCEAMSKTEDYNDLEALCNFWRNLALCPEPRVREGLFEYLKNNGFVITQQGLIVSLRRANSSKKSKSELSNNIKYVFDEYYKIKKNKKGVNNYVVIKLGDETYEVIHRSKVVENTTDLYELSNFVNLYTTFGDNTEMYFTAQNTTNTNYTLNGEAKSGVVEYHLFKETRISRQDCDHNPAKHCSYGLHNGTPEYVIGNPWLGDTILVCLTNPMDVVSVPEDGFMKFRTAALYPISIISEEEAKNFNADNGVVVLDDDYMNYTLEHISNLINTTTFESLKTDFVIPRELDKETVLEMLIDIRTLISKR